MKFLDILRCCYVADHDPFVQEARAGLNFIHVPALGIALHIVFLILDTGSALYEAETAANAANAANAPQQI